MKSPTGGTFTDAEAGQLAIGQSVYLPVELRTSGGSPIVFEADKRPGSKINLIPLTSSSSSSLSTLENSFIKDQLQNSFWKYYQSLAVGKGGTGGWTASESVLEFKAMVAKWWYSPERVTAVRNSKDYGAGIYQGQPFFFDAWAEDEVLGDHWLRDLDGKWMNADSVEPLGGQFDWNNTLIQKPAPPKWNDIEWDLLSGSNRIFHPEDQPSWLLGDNTDDALKSLIDPETNLPKWNPEVAEVYKKLSEASVGAVFNAATGYVYEADYPLIPAVRGYYHSGIDIGAPESTEVFSVTEGTLVTIEKEFDGVGDLVVVQERGNPNRYWMYLHLNVDEVLAKRFKNEGSFDIDPKKDLLGKVAPQSYTGLDPHLHLTVGHNEKEAAENAKDQKTILDRTMSPLQAYWDYVNRL